jgi:hypothetical protein
MAINRYIELLRDPRWQRKRLEVMGRDNFECTQCGDDSSTLNVHHGYYEKSKMPWEYPTSTLWTLCEACHAEVEEWRRQLNRAIGGLDPCHMDHIRGYALGLKSFEDPDLKIQIVSYEAACGFADFWGVDVRELLSNLGDCGFTGRYASEQKNATRKKVIGEA